jgi:D-cysteine desulfhydrase
LEKTLPRIALGTYPTPVQRLEGLDFPGVWVKRDDQTSAVYGGNKVRKLEFILADVIRRRKERIVTMGGLGTNHGLATAIYARCLDLTCRLLLYDQPVDEHVRRNLLLFHRYGAALTYCGSVLNLGFHFYLRTRLRDPGAYYLFAGGSTPVGAMGFVNAALELGEQVAAGELPEPDTIICPLGSGGTMAGLMLGVRLAGLRSQVIGVRVTESHLGPIPLITAKTVARLAEKTHRLLRRHSRTVPEVTLTEPQVIDTYFGPGYGAPTPEGTAAEQLARERCALELEPTYTAKTFAYLLDYLRDPAHAVETVLYWHTYNSVDLSREAEGVDYRELPAELQRFFRS